MSDAPLDATQIRERLESLVYMVLMMRRNVHDTADALAPMPRAAQERFIDATGRFAHTSVELAYCFCHFGVPGLQAVDSSDWPDWLRHLLELYDHGGTHAAIASMQDAAAWASAARNGRAACHFEQAAGVLEHFVRGLSGRRLQLEAAAETWTDTATLYLPAVVARFDDPAHNFRLYKAIAVHLWAQSWLGTWRVPLAPMLAAYPDRARAARLFHVLETVRLDARIARELPGIHRDMAALRDGPRREDASPDWARACRALAGPGARVHDTVAWLAALYAAPFDPQPWCYQGGLYPERTETGAQARQANESRALTAALQDLAAGRRTPVRFTLAPEDARDMPEGVRLRLQLDGQRLPVPPGLQALLDSMTADLGGIPPELLAAAGHGGYAPPSATDAATDTAAGDEGVYHYPEWDHVREGYRNNWCLLRVRDVHPQADDFVARTRTKYRHLRHQLSRTFEALRGDERRLRRQAQGEDIDLDAVVNAHIDRRLGREQSERLFVHRRKLERDVAAMFLVDMSGSTDGWINDVERESLVLLCEALEVLGDRYGIYGFSGFTHRRCEMYRIKSLEEPYSDAVRARISGIRAKEYTRLGVAIRHLSRLMRDIDARTRLLVTLSDGRPDDQDGYRGEYGIEDTRRALIEARAGGIHPYCITIDDEAMDYLPHMYGPAAFTIVDEVRKLPHKVANIYRRITL